MEIIHSNRYTLMTAVLGFADHVVCCNCSAELLVLPGAERCPMCYANGTLSWRNDSTIAEQEVHSGSTVYWLKEDFDESTD